MITMGRMHLYAKYNDKLLLNGNDNMFHVAYTLVNEETIEK